MTPLKIAPLPGCTPGTAEKIDALNRKLGSFIHAPLNLKEVLRMEPFAADAEVVRVVAATLDNYAILPTSPEERERQRTTGLPKDYDIVGFWYCVALLALSAEPEAVRYLLVLARILMVEDPAELFLLRRIVRLLEGFPFPHLQELRSRIEGFYDTVTHQLEAFRWLEAAGIPWPESYEWEVIAQFSSDGEPYADPAAPKEVFLFKKSECPFAVVLKCNFRIFRMMIMFCINRILNSAHVIAKSPIVHFFVSFLYNEEFFRKVALIFSEVPFNFLVIGIANRSVFIQRLFKYKNVIKRYSRSARYNRIYFSTCRIRNLQLLVPIQITSDVMVFIRERCLKVPNNLLFSLTKQLDSFLHSFDCLFPADRFIPKRFVIEISKSAVRVFGF